MRAVSRLIGVGYGLAGAGYAAMLWPAAADVVARPVAGMLFVLVAVGLLVALHGLITYALLTLKPWGRWPITVVNLLYSLFFVLAYKATAIAFILDAVLVGVIWWSWQPGFPAGAPGFRGSTGARAVLGKALLAVLVLLLGLVGFELRHHLRHCAKEFVLDGRDGCLMPLISREDTEYAGGYSAAAFAQLRVGMSQQGVLALLGPPLDQHAIDSGEVGWQWSRSPRSNSYRMRVVEDLP